MVEVDEEERGGEGVRSPRGTMELLVDCLRGLDTVAN